MMVIINSTVIMMFIITGITVTVIIIMLGSNLCVHQQVNYILSYEPNLLKFLFTGLPVVLYDICLTC